MQQIPFRKSLLGECHNKFTPICEALKTLIKIQTDHEENDALRDQRQT